MCGRGKMGLSVMGDQNEMEKEPWSLLLFTATATATAATTSDSFLALRLRQFGEANAAGGSTSDQPEVTFGGSQWIGMVKMGGCTPSTERKRYGPESTYRH